MNKIIAFSFLLLSMACATENPQSNKGAVAINNDAYNIYGQGFDISLQIEEVENDNYFLSAALTLDSGAYVISPFSQDTSYGHFDMSIEDSDNLIPDGGLIESPRSVAEYDPILEMPVNFVRKNTVYKQKLSLDTDDDFEVSGMVFLLIEPKCAPYEVKFKIAYHEGEMRVQKTSTSTTKEYQKWLKSVSN